MGEDLEVKNGQTGPLEIRRLDPDRVEWLESSWVESGLSENSKESYRGDVRAFNGWLDEEGIESINGEVLKRYFEELGEEYAPATVNRKRYSLLQVLKTYGEGFAPVVNAIDRTVKQNTKTYKTEKKVDGDLIPDCSQVHELIKFAEEEGRKRLALIIEFLWRTGVRVSELINIQDQDVNLNGKVVIRIRGKGHKERTVKIPEGFYEQIQDVFEGSEHLFETRGGNKYNRSNLYKQLTRLGKRAGANYATNPHAFRHARVTWMLDQGFSLKAVSNFLGHSSTSITADLYIHDSVDYDELFELDKN
ncbi:tyrosine-type recombinase/integrase [Candidatus Bipolaricaulota bacterium]|nr:tyrosine-type recombinase/integrase [Candidatus Bipolaricaulota bacterium]